MDAMGFFFSAFHPMAADAPFSIFFGLLMLIFFGYGLWATLG